MNEYDCWFQRQDREIDPLVFGRVRAEKAEAGSILEKAAAEYVRGMEKIFGVKVVLGEPPGPELPGGVVIGTMAKLKGQEAGLDSPKAGSPGPEGFVLRHTGSSLVIVGQDERGCLYGVYRCLSLLAQGKLPPGSEVSETPAAPLRIINHWDMADGAVVRGYAGKSLFFKNEKLDYDPARITDYARLLASVGINYISINNVNVSGGANLLITQGGLGDLAKLAALFRPFGIGILLSVNFAAPFVLKELDTADPLDEGVQRWWKERTAAVYRAVPDLGGFVVKADSEGESGPFQYGRTHADGANMLAAALEPHNGLVFWRCFVYNCTQDWRDRTTDRARSAYDHFMPLDGSFAKNVILQIKFGPYDFQVREPVSPLFGALKKTRHIMELQITQEYTGHQIDLCYLPWIWEDILNFDTRRGERARVRELMGSDENGIGGMAAVANVGDDPNWTGHTLAQANFYGYGRFCWNPRLTAAEIAREWTLLSFPGHRTDAAPVVADILLKSYPAYEKYNAPFGICFMVTPGLHYGPSVEGYEFSRWGTYHRTNREAVGIDRTPSGTGYTDQYAPENAAVFADPARCPENVILFFHRLPYGFRMKNGQTLLQNIYDTRFEGCEDVETMIEKWKDLKGKIGNEVYSSVLARMERQRLNAREWRDQVNTYFYRHTGIPDERSRKIYD
jgi:alpha-glucuronidase